MISNQSIYSDSVTNFTRGPHLPAVYKQQISRPGASSLGSLSVVRHPTLNNLNIQNYQQSTVTSIRDRYIYKGGRVGKNIASSSYSEEEISGPAANYLHIKTDFNPSPQKLKFLGETLYIRLSRLESGWAGPGSLAPSDNLITDVLAVLMCISPSISLPTVEVDPEDGYVTLLWFNDEKKQVFALVFSGNGTVIGSAPLQTDYQAWQRPIVDEIGIISQLEADASLGNFDI